LTPTKRHSPSPTEQNITATGKQINPKQDSIERRLTSMLRCTTVDLSLLLSRKEIDFRPLSSAGFFFSKKVLLGSDHLCGSRLSIIDCRLSMPS
jgi:hypothetical protein